MPLKLELSEVVLKTHEFSRLAAFYDVLLDGPRCRDITPAKTASRPNDPDTPMRMRFIPLDPQRRFGGDTLALFECELGREGPIATGLHHFQLKAESMSLLFQAYRRMKEGGHLPLKSQNHGLSTSLYYLDPDRNKVEINVRNFSTVEEEERYAATPEFSSNPAGCEIDVEAILALHASGGQLEELVWQKL